MELLEYQKWVMIRWGAPKSQGARPALGALGFELGELGDVLKKVLFHGEPITEKTRIKLLNELGDCSYYYGVLLNTMNGIFTVPSTPDDLLANILKLPAATDVDAFDPEKLTIEDCNNAFDAVVLAQYYSTRLYAQLYPPEVAYLLPAMLPYSVRRTIRDELGRCIRRLFPMLRLQPVVVTAANVAKLSVRYEKDFTTAESIARKDVQ